MYGQAPLPSVYITVETNVPTEIIDETNDETTDVAEDKAESLTTGSDSSYPFPFGGFGPPPKYKEYEATASVVQGFETGVNYLIETVQNANVPGADRLAAATTLVQSFMHLPGVATREVEQGDTEDAGNVAS